MRYRKMTPGISAVDYGDYVFGKGPGGFWVDVPDAVGQAVLTRLKLETGQWFLNLEDGTPWNTQVLGKYTADVRDPVIRARILDTQGVQEIIAYSSNLNRETRGFSIDVILDTIYGRAKMVVPSFESLPPPTLGLPVLVNLRLSNELVPEGSVPGTLVGNILSNKVGSSLILTNDAGGRFAIKGTDLVTGLTPIDHDVATLHLIIIREVLVQALNNPHDSALTIYVSALPEVPILVDLTLSNSSIPENSAAGTLVGTVVGRKAGSLLTLINSAGGKFAISGSNLVAGAIATDYEAASSHNIVLRETLGSSANSPHDTPLTIDVTNISEP